LGRRLLPFSAEKFFKVFTFFLIFLVARCAPF